MARPRQLSLEADKASGVCKTCCQTLSKLAICSVFIHPNPPLSPVINAYLNPLKAADEPWHCAGRVDAALYCTVLYCTVLYCTVLYCTGLYCTALYWTLMTADISIQSGHWA